MAETINPFDQKIIVVAIASDSKLVINRGRSDGIKKGDRFLVYRLGREINDPSTGRSLGVLEEVKGYGTAVHVQEQMTTIQSEKVVKKSRQPMSDTGTFSAYIYAMNSLAEVTNETIEVPFDSPLVGDLVKKL